MLSLYKEIVMGRKFSVLVSLSTDDLDRFPHPYQDCEDIKYEDITRVCSVLTKELEDAVCDVGYSIEGDNDMPENGNGHSVRVAVVYPPKHTNQGGFIIIREWFFLETGIEGEMFLDGNYSLTRDDKPDLWRIVDAWKERNKIEIGYKRRLS